MKQLVSFTIIFQKLSLSINNQLSFNLEFKSSTSNITLQNSMQIDNQFEQLMEVECTMKKKQSIDKFEEQIKTIYIVVTDGKHKKTAGFVTFDLAILLNFNLKQQEFILQLQNCPDKDAQLKFQLLFNEIQTIQSSIDSTTQRVSSKGDNDENRKLRLENAKLKYELSIIKDKLLIMEKQQEFVKKQHYKFLTEFKEQEVENTELQFQVEQLYKLNLICIEKIKIFENIIEELKTLKL